MSKYRITYRDTEHNKQVNLTVHSMKSVDVVLTTLNRQTWRYKDVAVQRIMPTRFRDIIIEVG